LPTFGLAAQGWGITRPNFHHNEWRTVIIIMCSFYLASSSLLLIRRIVLSSVVFWICTGLLYGGWGKGSLTRLAWVMMVVVVEVRTVAAIVVDDDDNDDAGFQSL
jgi:hypothetical protein